MLREVTKKQHRVQVTISLTFVVSKCIILFKIVKFCKSDSFFALFSRITDTILCHFTAVFHVVFRCFITGRRYVENPARFVNF